MIRFEHPEAFALAIPILLLLRRRGLDRGAVAILRIGMLTVLLALLAGPYRPTADAGRDLVLIVDRSRSVGERAVARARELLDAAAEAARDGDRIGIVSFGRDALLELAPADPATARSRNLAAAPDPDGSDLAAAIDRALAVVPPGRRGSLLVLSDGEVTGTDPSPAARAALRRGLTLDVVPIRARGIDDVAVEELSLPGEVGAGEPFRVVVWVRSPRVVTVPFRLLRDGQEVAAGERTLGVGPNRLTFRDVLADPGLHRYEIDLAVPDDRVRDNDRALGVLRCSAAPRLLCVSPGGRRGRLATGLAGLGLEVEVVDPGRAPLSLDGLDGFAAVVLENVPADDLPAGALVALQRFVEDLGGGLLMTGGKASFGAGGYRRSPLEEVLPVSMEIREEQRRFALALAVALDRSGSMTAPAGPDRTKMDLANLGTIAAVEMLGRNDEVAVIAVDSAPHTVVPLQAVGDLPEIVGRIRGIEAGGGGIFVGVAIEQMAAELGKSATLRRHMLLFADAADAEEPGRYGTLVPELREAGVTLSVIALGQPSDPDAALLLDLARLGGGRCKFVTDPSELPRLFAAETIEVARSSFADEPTAVAVLPDLLGLGELELGGFPELGGYSIAWPEVGASVGLRSADELAAPLLAFWQRGLGRAAAFLGEADGEASGALAGWDGYGGFFATLARWLCGARSDGGAHASLRRDGHQALLVVELDAAAPSDAVRAVALGPDGATPLWLERRAERRLEARFPLSRAGVHRVAVQVGTGRVLRPAPLTLPYSPEFEPRFDAGEGERALGRLAAIAGGRIDPPQAELLGGSRDSAGFESLAPLVGWLALLLLLVEIAVRRLELGARRPRPARSRSTAPAAAADVSAPSAAAEPPESRDLGTLLDRARERARGVGR